MQYRSAASFVTPYGEIGSVGVDAVHERADEVRADEAGAAGDECPHAAIFPEAGPYSFATNPIPSHVRASRGMPATIPCAIQTPAATAVSSSPIGARAPRA